MSNLSFLIRIYKLLSSGLKSTPPQFKANIGIIFATCFMQHQEAIIVISKAATAATVALLWVQLNSQ